MISENSSYNAGKTFLAAAAIEEAKARHRTLFVFASYVYRGSTTARSILQSLLFQLAFDAKDVQSVLVQSNERDLLGSTKYVSGLLKKLLNGVGPTYIVLDGLDEMDAIECRILLQELTNLGDCPETKILVSSRPEDDISKILETKTTGIRVDQRNSGSIQSYVNQRIRDWMHNGDFDQEAREQIQQLLAPLGANAKGSLLLTALSLVGRRFANFTNKGMFLYARIILDSAEQFTDLEEIERELKVLPLDLNDA